MLAERQLKYRHSSILAFIVFAAMNVLCCANALATQNYSLEIVGAPETLKSKLEQISRLHQALRDYPTYAALRRAAERDQKSFNEALQSAGYYQGKASYDLVAKEDTDQAKVVFTISPGEAFKIVEYEILFRDEAEDRPTRLEEANIKPDGSAAGADIRDVQLKFAAHLRENGFPNTKILGRRAIANTEEATAHAVFIFESGPKARFGEIKFDGLTATKPDFIRKLKTWDDGSEYERNKIISYRDRLAQTALFSSINVEPGAPDENGLAPVLVNLEERKRRTIGLGASFSTSEGPGGRIFFENRNIFRRGENLRIELSASEIEQAITFDIIKPLPSLPGNAFGNFELSNETTDAFDARSLRISSGLAKKWLNDNLETRAALAFETSKVKSESTEERTYFVSTPLSVLWDSENDLLNPTKGLRASMVVTPYTGSDTFFQTEFAARSRVHFGSKDRFTLAARASVGATFGSTLDDLPQNKRLYAGGGGSVRGFGFQEAGPLDADGVPIGGRSNVEGAFEGRMMVSKNIQLAAFVDTGLVSESATPDFTQPFFVGFGGGVRYFTPIGPIRADIAFPTNKRETDRSFQIYIALGQSF